MIKKIIFDMDGTIADLYGVNNWLDMLIAKDETPYRVARPFYDSDILNMYFQILREKGFKIEVTSWLAKNSTPDYDKKVIQAKKEWIARQGLIFDDIHIVPYGTPKSTVTKADFQILVDDEEKNLKEWKGLTINAKYNIIESLTQIIEREF